MVFGDKEEGDEHEGSWESRHLCRSTASERVQASDVQPSTEIGGKKEEEIPDEGDDDKKTRKQRTRKEINRS